LHKAQTNNQNHCKNREIGNLKMTNKNDLGFIVHTFIRIECFIILQQTTTLQVTTYSSLHCCIIQMFVYLNVPIYIYIYIYSKPKLKLKLQMKVQMQKPNNTSINENIDKA